MGNAETYWKKVDEIIICKPDQRFSIGLGSPGVAFSSGEAVTPQTLENVGYKQISSSEFMKLVRTDWYNEVENIVSHKTSDNKLLNIFNRVKRRNSYVQEH